jgi:hypothetical protein
MAPLSNEQSKWMKYVASNPGAMSQRRLATVEKWDGGLDLLIVEAASHNVHLIQLIDDHNTVLIGASVHEFKVLA